MVIVKNIKLIDNLITMDCYKEGLEDGYFSMVVDAKTYQIISSSLGKPSIYSQQVVSKIIELRKNNQELPSEIKCVWC